MKNKKFIIGLIAGITLGAVASFILAWTDPSDHPTNAQGAIYTSGNNIKITKKLYITGGEMELGDNDNPSGIQMFDQQNGQKQCLQIKNGAVFIKNGDCTS